MSGISSPKISSLPENLEEAVANAQNKITNLKTEMDILSAHSMKKKKDYEEEEVQRNTKIEELKKEDGNLSLAINSKKEKLSNMDVDIANKTSEVNNVAEKINNLNKEFQAINESLQKRIDAVKEREENSSKKESALVVYANSLEEKERKINKYLAIFDNMKATIIRD